MRSEADIEAFVEAFLMEEPLAFEFEDLYPEVAVAVRTAYEMLDTGLEAQEEYKGRVCREGCYRCCSDPVLVSPPQGLLVALSVDPDGFRARYKEWEAKVDRASYFRALHEKDEAANVEDIDKANDLEERAVQAYGKGEAVFCPFLDEGTCSIYELRPDACRTFFSISRDCEPYYFRITGLIPSFEMFFAYLSIAIDDFKGGLLPVVVNRMLNYGQDCVE